jgi:hypothetical protein
MSLYIMHKANNNQRMRLTNLKHDTAYLDAPIVLPCATIGKGPPRVIDCHYTSCTRPTNMIEYVQTLSKMVLPTWKHSQYHHGASVIAWVQNMAKPAS